MAVTVVDSGNLEQVFAEAAGEKVESAQPAPPTKAEKAAAKAEAKAEAKTADKPAEKVEAKVADKPAEAEAEDDADDVEGEDGLTVRQKRELSAKMLKAIGKKHRQVKEAEEFASHQVRLVREAERRAAELERELAQRKPQQAPAEQVEPKRENFATETEFIDARIKWGVDQGIARREAERQEGARVHRVQEQLERARQLIPDFEKVTSASLNWPGAVAQYMRDSDLFAELGYHFASNPKELERIAALTPVRQLVEVGKIEARLSPFGSAKDTKEPDGKAQAAPSTQDTGFSPSKARSDAPVIKPLNGDGQAVDPDPKGMTTREMIQAFQKAKGVNLSTRRRH